MFDFFTKAEPKKKTEKTAQPGNAYGERRTVNFNQGGGDTDMGGYKVVMPRSFEDVSGIIDLLSVNKPVIVNLKELRDDTAQRVLDMLCGAVCALKGGVYELEKNIYVFSPDSISSN